MEPDAAAAQLKAGMRMIDQAFAQTAAHRESELAQLRAELSKALNLGKVLGRRIEGLEHELSEANDRCRVASEMESRAIAENSRLLLAVKALNRERDRFDSMKRSLAQTLTDSEHELPSELPRDSKASSALVDILNENVFDAGHDSPAPRQERTPTGSVFGLSPPRTSGYNGAGIATPSSSEYARVFIGSSPPVVSRRSSPAVPLASPKMEGKEFFRAARARLSYEDFSFFLGSIKELNAHRLTREEALHKAAVIFGSSNHDLHSAFEALLSRHMP